MKNVNKAFRKKDAMQLVTGKPVYMDDLAPADCLIVKLYRSPHANAMVERIAPAVFEARRDPDAGYDDVVIENVRQTVTAIREKSAAVDRAITEGRTAIVGALYNLAEGTVTPVHTEGRVNGG